jgi:lysophospholipase L1-like esterase
MTLLLGLMLEGLYRAQAALKESLRRSSVHPNEAEPWWEQWAAADGIVNGPSRFDPYRSWWPTQFASRYVQVDSGGRRRTVPTPDPGPIQLRVLFLGGSVMWGYTTPDSLTIPSLVARRLRALGHTHVALVNLAQPSYNTTQGLISLLLELRAGARPDVVISLDGNNDVLATIREGRPGAALGEGDLAQRSAVGWRGLSASLLGLSRYSAVVRRLRKIPRPAREGATGGAEGQSCAETAQYYVRLVASGEALGRELGFQAVYLWQPHWATTGKPFTAWERSIDAEAGFPALMRRCTALVDSLMAERRDSAFVSLAHLFDSDSATIFLDEFGHMTPAGNQRVASQLADLLAGRLARLRASLPP